MKQSFYSILFLMVALVATSCANIKEIEVGNIKNVELKGINNNILNVAISVPVTNPNGFDVKLKDADMQVKNGETLVGTIKQIDNTVISKQSSKDYTFDLKIEIATSNFNLISLYGLFNNHPDLRLSGTIKVRSFPYFGKIKIKDYQLIR